MSPPSSDSAPAASFELDPRLHADSIPVVTLGLCQVRLHKDSRYPWLLLIPRVCGAVEILDLDLRDQERLWTEIRLAVSVLRDLFQPTKLNVAALGNQVPQLHIHVIARFAHDAAWPGPVWGAHAPIPYEPDAEAKAVLELQGAFALPRC